MNARRHAHIVRCCLWLAALVQVVVLSSSAPAYADDKSEARGWFERGLVASRNGEFAEAVQAFQRSRELSERPSVLQNLAVALEHLGRYREALDAVERAMELAKRTGHKQPEGLEPLRVELSGKVAELRFEVTPDDALVELDGVAVAGRTVRCDPGRHELSVSAPGFRREQRRLTVAEGARTVERVALQAQIVAVHAEPAAPVPSERAPDVAPAPGRERKLLPWALVTLGAGVAMAGAGTALQLHAASRNSDWNKQCADGTGPECDKRSEEVRSIQRLDRSSFALFGLAGASALVATTLFWLHGREQRRPVALLVSPRQLQLSVRF